MGSNMVRTTVSTSSVFSKHFSNVFIATSGVKQLGDPRKATVFLVHCLGLPYCPQKIKASDKTFILLMD